MKTVIYINYYSAKKAKQNKNQSHILISLRFNDIKSILKQSPPKNCRIKPLTATRETEENKVVWTIHATYMQGKSRWLRPTWTGQARPVKAVVWIFSETHPLGSKKIQQLKVRVGCMPKWLAKGRPTQKYRPCSRNYDNVVVGVSAEPLECFFLT